MRGDIILKILEIIGGTVVNASDVLTAILTSGYGASHAKIAYNISEQRKERRKRLEYNKSKRQIEQKYYNLVYYLKRGGFLKEKHKNNKKLFILTIKGKEKLSYLKRQRVEKLPELSYFKKESDKFIIVIFDIPEVERKKRNWLRAALGNLGLKMIQKSVWMGKVKIPKEFLADIHKLKLVDYIEIFEISKTGSLEHLI